MHTLISRDENWQAHFTRLLSNSTLVKSNAVVPTAISQLEKACKWLANNSKNFRRQTLQTRFFETGDNFYLGMELPREYQNTWKRRLVEQIILTSVGKGYSDKACNQEVDCLKGLLCHHLDRLFYESTLETIRTGDVYNPGARHRVPRLHVIGSCFDAELGSLPVGESFRVSISPEEFYEVLVKKPTTIIVRNSEGYISRFGHSTKVKRESNLTRSPDGNVESKVALATFPVCHFVNHRTMLQNETRKEYVFAFAGDEQATPHFMRYR